MTQLMILASSCTYIYIYILGHLTYKSIRLPLEEKKNWFPKAFLIDPFSGSASTALAEVFYWKSPLDGSCSMHGQSEAGLVARLGE